MKALYYKSLAVLLLAASFLLVSCNRPTSPGSEEAGELPAAQQPSGVPVGEAGIEDAKRIALQHAGLLAENTVFTRAETDDEAYKLEFVSDDTFYEVEILLADGRVVDYSLRPVNGISTSDMQYNWISVDDAVTAALTHLSLAGRGATLTELGIRTDNGRIRYHVAFSLALVQYEVDVDPVDGRVLKVAID